MIWQGLYILKNQSSYRAMYIHWFFHLIILFTTKRGVVEDFVGGQDLLSDLLQRVHQKYNFWLTWIKKYGKAVRKQNFSLAKYQRLAHYF